MLPRATSVINSEKLSLSCPCGYVRICLQCDVKMLSDSLMLLGHDGKKGFSSKFSSTTPKVFDQSTGRCEPHQEDTQAPSQAKKQASCQCGGGLVALKAFLAISFFLNLSRA